MKDLTDEEFENVMASISRASVADDGLVNQIADSPQLWWSVQRQISERAKPAVGPWPPANWWRRWLMIGVPVVAAVLVLMGVFVTMRDDSPSLAELPEPKVSVISGPSSVPSQPEPAVPVAKKNSDVTKPTDRADERAVARTITNKRRPVPSSPKPINRGSEIKTDFIALTYARNPESGQVVRVRVPSSMMVSLGLVPTVEKPSALVDAEVLVGDDGTTHSIRFIR